MSIITAQQDGAFMRAHIAHQQLAKALAELRATLDTPATLRAVSVSITEAESSWLWLRAAADRVGVKFPEVDGGPCQQVGDIIHCRCGAPASHYGTMGERGAREVREA